MERIHIIPETGSTNADLRARAADWPEGSWLCAERQTAGRGRLGRTWQSPQGNLHASTLIRLSPGDPPATGLGLMMGVVVHSALLSLVPKGDLRLKWPNDVMCGPAKLAGMLLERDGDCVIAGVGINIATAPALPDRETIALADLRGGAAITLMSALDALVYAFDKWITAWRICGTPGAIDAWLPLAHPVGTRLTVSTGADAPQIGAFLGLDPDGALILGRDDGTEVLVHSGDVGLL